MERSLTFTIRFTEVDQTGRLSPVALLQLMQEAAAYNAASVGASVYDLHALGVTWAMIRMDLRLERLPGVGETVRVDTWPSGADRSLVYRDYRLYDAAGQSLGVATSTWLVLALATRRMTPIPAHLLPLLPPPPDCTPLPRSQGKLPPPGGPDLRRIVPEVRWFDIDPNGHASNSHYLRWCLEALPTETLRHSLTRITFTIRAEASLGEALQVEASPLPGGQWAHSIRRDDSLLAQACSWWG